MVDGGMGKMVHRYYENIVQMNPIYYFDWIKYWNEDLIDDLRKEDKLREKKEDERIIKKRSWKIKMNEQLNFALFFIFSKYSYREVAPALWQFEVNVQTKRMRENER